MQIPFISQEISHFLKHRRARLAAGDFGFSVGRRRGNGLRREEVAQLSGVSVTWYTWLEQGKSIHVSQSMLLRLADALRLSATEQSYFLSLIRERDAVLGDSEKDLLPSTLVKTVDAISTPAFVRNPRWDLLYWNTAAAAFVGDWTSYTTSINILRLAFLDRKHQATILEWERTAGEMVAQFRNEFGHHARYPGMSTLIEELMEDSEIFRRHWEKQEVSLREIGLRTFRHPLQGDVTF